MCRKFLSVLILILMLSAAGSAAAAERPVVKEIVVTREGGGARVEIRADKPLTYTSYPMPGLEKWVIDLAGTMAVFSDDQFKKVKSLPLTRVSLRQREINGEPLTRVGLDYSGEVEFSIAADPLDRGRLVVLVVPAGKEQKKTPPAGAAQ